ELLMAGVVASARSEQPAIGVGVLDGPAPAAEGDHLLVAGVGGVEGASEQQLLGLVVEPRELDGDRVDRASLRARGGLGWGGGALTCPGGHGTGAAGTGGVEAG